MSEPADHVEDGVTFPNYIVDCVLGSFNYNNQRKKVMAKKLIKKMLEEGEVVSEATCIKLITRLLSKYSKTADKLMLQCEVDWECMDLFDDVYDEIMKLGHKMSDELNGEVPPAGCDIFLDRSLVGKHKNLFYTQGVYKFLKKQVDKSLEEYNYDSSEIETICYDFIGSYTAPMRVVRTLVERLISDHKIYEQDGYRFDKDKVNSMIEFGKDQAYFETLSIEECIALNRLMERLPSPHWGASGPRDGDTDDTETEDTETEDSDDDSDDDYAISDGAETGDLVDVMDRMKI